jgi:hypothetical protein
MNHAEFTNPLVPESRCPSCLLPVGIAHSASDRRPRLIEKLVPSFDSTFVVLAALLLSGAIAAALEFMTHIAVSRMHTPLAYHAFIDASVITLMTIALVGVGITSARARRHTIILQIRTVEELNHHLRNALQVIALSRHLPEDKQAQAVFDSMDRIAQALRRITPK